LATKQTKNLLLSYMAIWSVLRSLGIFCGHLVYFMAIWYLFRFGMLYQEKSGNPDGDPGKAG
jgi:hypothetical protein